MELNKASLRQKFRYTRKLMWRNRALYLMVLPILAHLIIFHYWPLYGIQIAFRDYTFADGITGSKWVGLKWFNYFFNSPQFSNVIINTFLLSLYGLLAGFPAPILLALMLHNIPGKRYRKLVQTVTYMPHFISVVVMVGMLSSMFSLNSGIFNTLIKALGGEPAYFMGEPKYFRNMYVWSGVWQGIGWGSILYMAALTGISQELHEAAMIDGANKLQRIWHIELPGIAPTIVIQLILACGGILSVGFDKIYLMQNSLNRTVSEVISTYTYKMGMVNSKFSYSSAIGMFNTVINFIFLSAVNFISKRVSDNSLW